MRKQLDAPPLEVLDRTSCLELLASDVVGRLAVVVKGAPQITPVNYVLDGEVLVFRSGPGSKLRAAERAPACLEIDHFDVETRTGWSVVASGRLEEITPYQATLLTAAQRLPIDPWAGGPKMHWLRLIPSRITGRRIVTATQSTSSLGVATTKAKGPADPGLGCPRTPKEVALPTGTAL